MLIAVLYIGIILIYGFMTDSKDVRQRKRYVVTCSIILFLVAGLRNWKIGTDDTYLYIKSYFNIHNYSFKYIFSDFGKDPTYYAFTKVLSYVCGDDSYTPFLLVLSAIFAISSGILIYKYSKNPILSYVILICMGFFSFSMNGLRQMIAISILMFSYGFLAKRNFRNFIYFATIVGIASLFHKTALIFLLAYPIALWKFSIKTIPIYIGIILVCVFFGFTIIKQILLSGIDNRLYGYNIYSRTLSYSGLIQYALILILSCFWYRRAIHSSETNAIPYNLLVLAIIFQSMSMYIAEFFRVAMYFGIFATILLPLSFEYSVDRRQYTNITIFLLLIYFFFMGAGTSTYKFFWQQWNPF